MTAAQRAAWHKWANDVTAVSWERAKLVGATAPERFEIYEQEVNRARLDAVKTWPEAPHITFTF